MTDLLLKIVTMMLFSGESIRDGRTGQVAMLPVLAASFAGAVLRTCSGAQPPELALCLTPGLGMLLISAATKEAAGYGDGWILAAAGLLNGVYITLLMLCVSLAAMLLVFIMIWLGGDMGKNERLPFVPFLAAAYGAVIIR